VKKLKCFIHDIFEYSARQKMNRKQQEQYLINQTARLLMDDKLTPEQVCSFIVTLRDAGIIADDILDPTNPEEEEQQSFNEIAGVYANWKITTEEACELFVEWVGEVNAKRMKNAQKE
jgi:hypothetical protein